MVRERDKKQGEGTKDNAVIIIIYLFIYFRPLGLRKARVIQFIQWGYYCLVN